MKKSTKLMFAAIVLTPAFLSASEMMGVGRPATTAAPVQMNPQQLQRYVSYQCPNGWNKTLDITNNKSSWSENSPVLTCKPSPSLINCPEGTFFYMSGNPNVAGSAGELGCRTPVW